jgi:hypothetical protein
MDLKDLVVQYQSTRDKLIMEEIVQRMQPIMKKYVRKIYCIEKEEARQDLLLELIEAVNRIKRIDSESACVSYLASSIYYKYLYICKVNLSKGEKEELEDSFQLVSYHEKSYNDTIFYTDLYRKLDLIATKKKKIIEYLLLGYSDSEIALMSDVSRQYINRIKKEVI